VEGGSAGGNVVSVKVRISLLLILERFCCER
jgi:hypothetical protein